MDDARRTGQQLIECCKRWIAQPDAPALAWNQYACALMGVDTETPPELHDAAEALRAAERANELAEGKDANILDTLAMACHRTGDLRRAVELQRQAAEMAPGDGIVRTRLAEYEAALSR
jgi:tetratricopeptide (TPR) repeat protein